MSSSNLLLVLLLLTTAGYVLGRKKAVAVAHLSGSGPRVLHSRPTYYGALAALWCAVPALVVFAFWQAFESTVITQLVVAGLPADLQTLPSERLGLVMNDIKNLVSADIVSGEISPATQAAADHYVRLQTISHATLAVLALTVGIAGILWIRKRITPWLRARNHVETMVKYLLVTCASIAIFTTIGIVLSVLYEAIRFLRLFRFMSFIRFGLEPPDGHSGGPGRIFRGFWRHPGLFGNPADFRHCHVRSCSRRTDVRHFCLNMRTGGSGPWPSRSWKSWRESPRWCTDFLRPLWWPP